MNSTGTGEFYDVYKDYGVVGVIVPPTLFMFACFLLGTYGNVQILLASVKSKYLRSTCNYLLAMCSMADSLHMSAHCYLLFLVLSGRNFVQQSTCYYVQFLPVIGLISGHCLIFAIGVDRLLSVVIPTEYKRINRRLYFATIVVFCLGVSAVFLGNGYANLQDSSNREVMCLVTEGHHGPPMQVYVVTVNVISVATVVCYVAVWICIKIRFAYNRTTDLSAQEVRIFKSLTVIVVILMACYILGSLLAIIWRRLPPVQAFIGAMYGGIPINIGCSCNYVVLYFCSSEYRAAFKKPIVQFRNPLIFASLSGQWSQQVAQFNSVGQGSSSAPTNPLR